MARWVRTPSLGFSPSSGPISRVLCDFPLTSCSCLAQSDCYYVMAARMAIIGVNDRPPKRKLKLIQLRWNVCKRPDKTSGRKHPRLQDVVSSPPETPMRQQLSFCRQYNSPITMARHHKLQLWTKHQSCAVFVAMTSYLRAAPAEPTWIQCDECPRWFHNICVDLCCFKRGKTFVSAVRMDSNVQTDSSDDFSI